MCAIVGAIACATTAEAVRNVNDVLETIWERSRERGRDGAGYMTFTGPGIERQRVSGPKSAVMRAPRLYAGCGTNAIIGNLRAEPTTEYVKDKRPEDQQPYTAGGWSIVHNGTIANDKVLRTGMVDTGIDSAAIAEQLSKQLGSHDHSLERFKQTIRMLKGSYAILAVHKDKPGVMYVAANYRPVWFATNEHGTFFASSRDYFPEDMVPQMLEPYSVARFECGRDAEFDTLHRLGVVLQQKQTALVVCSGGLDSVVAACYAQRTLGYNLHLIHFLYGSRAEGPEVQAVTDVYHALGKNGPCELTLFPLNVYSKGDSPLLDSDAKVAGGEAGAEFAHEWVPARNLLLLSVATAFAEARGYSTIVLGNNLEEAGAYPDNEPEFIAKFNDLLPFAVGDGKRMHVIMPVGNLMKHEIVALGNQLKAPMHLTWSCYRAGAKHCGTCGPCFMRRTAFDINKLPEVIEYVPVN